MPLAWCQMLAARLVESSEAAGKKMYPDFFNVFFFFLWTVIFHNAVGKLKKGLVYVKVIKEHQHDPLDLFSFCSFP